MYLLGHTDPTLTMRVYQQVIDMGEGGVQTLELAIGCTVRAAAVVEVAADRVVVVAVDGRDGALLYERADLVGMRAVADQIPAAVDPLDAEVVDVRQRRLQRRQVAVDVGDHCNGAVRRRAGVRRAHAQQAIGCVACGRRRLTFGRRPAAEASARWCSISAVQQPAARWRSRRRSRAIAAAMVSIMR
jgi:hypothetical protein